jgi:hypothetical protein
MEVEATVVGGVRCLVVSPRADAYAGTIVFVHGGGYIWMTAGTHLPVAAGLVRASGCRCVSVDYRRAPEHPYPAPVEDLVAVYRGLLDQGESADRSRSPAIRRRRAGGRWPHRAGDTGDAPRGGGQHSPWTDLAGPDRRPTRGRSDRQRRRAG